MNVLSKLRSLGSSDGYTIPVLLALFLHGLAVLGMVISAPVMTERRITPMPSYIMAKAYVSMPESKLKPLKKPVAIPRKSPEKKPEKSVAVKSTKEKVPAKPVKSEPDREKALAERQRHEAEQEREANAERKEAQRVREQEVLAAFEREQREQERIAEQLEADAGVVNGYVAIIEQLVRQNWHRPPSARKGMTVKLRVRLTPTGEIMGIETLQGSGNFAFDGAAIRAVRQAAPFRELGQLDNRLFENNFREFNFYFDPQDLLE